jgi:hypothetical protein
MSHPTSLESSTTPLETSTLENPRSASEKLSRMASSAMPLKWRKGLPLSTEKIEEIFQCYSEHYYFT